MDPLAHKPLRVALVHDWLTGMRGGEYVLEAIAELFPRAELFTLLYVPGKISPLLTTLPRHESFIARLPQAEHRYRYYLPLMPRAIESFDLSAFDLVISTSHCVAKGVLKRPDAVHVSVVFTPMRYIWDRYDEYFGAGRAGIASRLAARLVRSRLQEWDRRASQSDRVDHLIGISRYISDLIQTCYGRSSEVISCFADLERFRLGSAPRGRHYLMVGAFAPYKRVDLAIDAFNQLKLPLLIVGGGQDERRLRQRAGPTIEFLGSLSNSAIADLYAKCRAFVFPGKEDFGITPIEAMASGAPVIAYGAGGILDTVTPETGILFREQTSEALQEAVLKVERGEISFDPVACRAQAERFSRAEFQRKLRASIERTWSARGHDPARL